MMKVLYLGVKPFPLTPVMMTSGCTVVECDSVITVAYVQKEGIDFIVSYRCPHIIKKDVIDAVKGRIINLHISLLPWNRGSDPNLWSFLEDTPKGVTIHWLDEGLDTGDILAQKELFFRDSAETLASSYVTLSAEMELLFKEKWNLIMAGELLGKVQVGAGSKHFLKDKKPLLHLLEKAGWDTPVRELVGKGGVCQQ